MTPLATGSACLPEPTPQDPVRVLLVDDSLVVRGLMARILGEEPAIQVVATVGNGQLAIDRLRHTPADVVVLDIEMPVMDGLTALPRLLEIDRGLRIIIASTLSTRNAQISIRCLEAGAADYIPKPTASREISGFAGSSDAFRRELVAKVLVHGGQRRRSERRDRSLPRLGRTSLPSPSPSPSPAPRPPASRKPSASVPRVLAIGSSTGGPQALQVLLKGLGSQFRLPILITQHMPPMFTTILAKHIAAHTGVACAEAEDGEPLRHGRAYLAPGDYHMLVETRSGGPVLRLTQEPPVNFCRPAVDVMYGSVARCFGAAALAVVLTGMGCDGLKGGEDIVRAGGTVLAQDETSSVVWGMPGAVATAGLCSAVLPLPELAALTSRLATGAGR
jgi:two-component system chemotaxis response regulator CheB